MSEPYDPNKSVASISNEDLLREKALTIRLFRKKISRNKLDKVLGEELRKMKNVSDDVSLRVNKSIFTKDATDAFMKILSEAGKYYYRVTTPWDDTGFRLLSVDIFKEFVKKFKTYTRSFREAVEAFMDGVEGDINKMEETLGTAFNRADYDHLFLSNGELDRETLRKSFCLELEYGTVSGAGDIRAELTQDDREIIAAHITAQNERKFAATQKHIITCLHEHILKIHERLCDSEKIFRDTLIENLNDLCDLIPKMNIAGDPVLNQLAIDAKRTLCHWDAQTLREDDAVRSDVAEAADQILGNMKGLI